MSEPLDTPVRKYGTAMRRVADREILNYAGGSELISALSFLEMGCFDGGNCYEIGLLRAHFPAHDRWFYTIEKQDLIARASWRLATLMEYGTCSETHSPESEEDLVFEIEELQTFVARAVLASTPEGGAEWAEISRLQHAALGAWRAFGHHGLEPQWLRMSWDQDTHDLIRHHDRWVARHPEAEGLPRELIMRMHGFGDYMDAEAAGYPLLRNY
jgi:hypothetical protein